MLLKDILYTPNRNIQNYSETSFNLCILMNGVNNYLLHMLSISKHADLHFGTRYVRQLNRAAEPLVLLGVIVFQSNL